MLQEMASRGLSAVYRLGDERGRSELLGSLMGTLQGVDSPPCTIRVPGAMQCWVRGFAGLFKPNVGRWVLPLQGVPRSGR